MTATPNFASNALAAEAAGATPAATTGPFVLNLCSSTTPMALPQADLPELKRFTFFVSRRFEEGRERFRLHMGYFATLAEAEEWLSLVREIYPGAWAGETPGRKLRERATAAAVDQARHAAGPQKEAPSPSMPWLPAARPASFAAPAAPAARPPASRQFSPSGAPAAVPTAAPPPRVAPPAARTAARPSAAPTAAPRSPAIQTPRPGSAPSTPAAARPAPRASPAPAATRTAPQPSAAPAAARRGTATPDAAAAARAVAAATRAAAPPAAARPGKASAKGVFQDSNVREVLRALADASATGETRMMPAPPPPPRPPETEASDSSLTDTQVLKLLDKRRTEGAPPPPAEIEDGGISLLKPDDTQTRRALREAIATNAPVAFAVQLLWSVQAVELDKVPPLAIFAAYTLYTVEGSREGRKWYGLRLGFFSDAISAKQVAYYVRSEFSSVAVVPVSPQEKARATGQEIAVTMPAPSAPRSARREEFKLIDDNEATGTHEQVAAAPATRPAPRAAARSTAKAPPAPVRSASKAPPAAATPPNAAARSGTRGNARVGARDRRGPQTLDETLEILGASELSIDTDNDTALSDSGVRHLQVEVQKNSPFSRLLERLSERVKKP